MAASVSYVPELHEQAYYLGLFRAADIEGTGNIGGAQAVKFFARSKLPVEVLKNIWTVADQPSTSSLDHKKFAVAVRLIQLTQNGQKGVGPRLFTPPDVQQLRPVFFEGMQIPNNAPNQQQQQQHQQQATPQQPQRTMSPPRPTPTSNRSPQQQQQQQQQRQHYHFKHPTMRLLLPLPFMIISSSVSVSAFHTTATSSMRPTSRKAGRRKAELSRRYSTIPGFYDYAGTSSSFVSNEEQENADTYLEFLDQRYNRVHNDESNGWLRRASTPFGKKKKKKKTEQQPGKTTNNDNENTSSSAPSSVFSFCAMDWLMNTGGKHTSTPTSTPTSTSHGNGNTNTMSTSFYDEIVASCTTSRYQRQQQQEAEDDALYILGVAGLASHKLLQKHHLLTTTTIKAVADIDAKKTFLHMETKDSDDCSGSENTNNEGTLQTKEMAMRTAISLTQSYVVKNMIVPFLRVLFYIEGRKQAVKRALQQRVMETALKPTTKLIVATVVNYYHSWKRYIHRTVAYGSVVLAIIAYNKNTILTSLQS